MLNQALRSAITMMEADFGNIQLRDLRTGALKIVAQSGFHADFLEYFAVVDDDGSACGRAAKKRAQTVVADVCTDAAFAPHREIATASSFRAVQSTPLVDRSGRLLGMVSTHYRRPWRPPAPALRVMEWYADRVAQAYAGMGAA